MIHLVLVHPEIPHNTGAIGRLCVGLDCELHLIRPLGFQLSERFLQRAGLDYWPHVRLSVHDSWEAFLNGVNPPLLFFFSTRGTQSLYDGRFEPGSALIFGSEGRGLPPEHYAAYRTRLFKIPMPGKQARSINLANAAAIAAYEAYRQLTEAGR
ncbi:MAG: tRNA (cytidine(34)-2'-O)-methyltransferase [Kiritimatiellae bacterium]|nr:tRNA (cytidine(34)-2'-O)-methyltransferase [Kiritimatiellia bacterium]